MENKINLSELKNQLEQVIRYSQNFNHTLPLNGIDEILNKWLKAKELFINHMGGKLIYEYPSLITFKLDANAKKNKLEQFADLVDDHYGNYYLYKFLSNIKVDDFYNNKTTKEYYVCDSIIIPENYKVVKAFKFFIDDEHLLEEVRNAASRIIQENVVHGKLCFSVHPLDFLSASENTYNWRSCHSLDGDYRSGNLNYLLDNSTVICYLKGEKEEKLPHFPESVPWNSKKWRVWMFFSEDQTMLFMGRQYPFSVSQGIDIIKNTILPELKFDTWSPYSEDKIYIHKDSLSEEVFHFDGLIPVGGEAIPIKKLVKDGNNTFHYNDVLNSHFYNPLYAYRIGNTDNYFSYTRNSSFGMTNADTRFKLGEACPCPICGHNEIDYGEIMSCISCCQEYYLLDEDAQGYGICDVCGAHIYDEDLYYLEISESYVCPRCYQNETVKCQICNTIDLPEVIKYREGDPRCLCEDCYHTNKPKDIIGKFKYLFKKEE